MNDPEQVSICPLLRQLPAPPTKNPLFLLEFANLTLEDFGISFAFSCFCDVINLFLTK